MSVRAFLKQCLMRFFVIVTFVIIVMPIVGPLLQPDIKLEYDAFYSPLIIGVLATLPSFILYSPKELNLRQTVLRKILHLIALEMILTLAAWLTGSLSGFSDALLFMICVLTVYIAVTLVAWLLQRKEAKDINAMLKELQKDK